MGEIIAVYCHTHCKFFRVLTSLLFVHCFCFVLVHFLVRCFCSCMVPIRGSCCCIVFDHCSGICATLTEVFSVLFPQSLGECQGITLSKDGARLALSKFFSLCKLVSVWLYICRVMPPPGANPIAVK